jgi:hypothetical protein
MNDFASALSTALHERAQETAMSLDMQQAERQLRESIRSADRRRRIWIAVAAAAAVLVAVAGVAFAFNRPTAQPTHPKPSPTQSAHTQARYPANASHLTPPLTAQLPYWVAFAHDTSADVGVYLYNQERCLPCQTGRDLKIQMYTVRYMFPLDASEILRPSYTAYVKAWEAVQPLGYGTVTDIATTTVGDKPATTMTVSFTKATHGLAACNELARSRTDTANCWYGVAGRTLRLAIVDQGKGQPPTLLVESSNTDNPSSAAITAEFTAWLDTVRFH